MVDGMNVIGSRPDGWWRDRDGAVRALLARLQHLAAGTAEQVTHVLDGRPLRDVAEGEHAGVLVLYAATPGGSADDRIVDLVSSAAAPHELQVVTSDRALRRRVGALGAEVVGAGAFLRRLDESVGR